MPERILLVDDSPEMTDWLQEVLGKAGYEALSCTDAGEAAAWLERQSEHLDLMLTDVRMPEVGGLELRRTARRQRVEMPVLVMTAYATVVQAVEMVNWERNNI